MSELKPCPNCGSSDPWVCVCKMENPYAVFAHCSTCGVRGPWFQTSEEAYGGWNNLPRHQEPQPIETAPKDTWILVGRLGLSNWVASYYSRDGFTHWLPMPPLPIEPASTGFVEVGQP